MVRARGGLMAVGIVVSLVLTTAGPAHSAPAAQSSTARVGQAAVKTVAAKATPKPKAKVKASATVLSSGKVRVKVTSNASKVTLEYRTKKNVTRTATVTVRKGTGTKNLSRGYRPLRVRAKASATLAASAWAKVSMPAAPKPTATPKPTTTPAPTPTVPVVGNGAYTITPDSPILTPMSKYSTVNEYTRDYYLIRSYMHRFEAAGGGTLVLAPGRYEISSTIYVPSNVTIRLSAGTTLVKLDKTGTTKFKASASIFMLISPTLGKISHSVGKHDGAAHISIVGAGDGTSVIDMAYVYNSLAIIAGHNRDVTISGISFKRMNNNHFIEMDGCADCVISDNEFLDAAAGTRATAEAINLDTPDPNTHGFSSIWSAQDATPNEGVDIVGNRFDGLQRAFGTHNFSAGRYHADIVVRDNVLTNMRNDGIHIMNWKDAVFTGNRISAASTRSGISACGTLNPTITTNTFSTAAKPVKFRTCSGENGTTVPNVITSADIAALRKNTAGAGLGKAAVSVPDYGTVWFDGFKPAA